MLGGDDSKFTILTLHKSIWNKAVIQSGHLFLAKTTKPIGLPPHR